MEEEITDTFGRNQLKLNLMDQQRERRHKKCLVLVEFAWVERIGPALEHQGNMDDRLIIDKIGDVLERTSNPYNDE